MPGARLPEPTFWQRVRREVTVGRAVAAVLVLAAAGAGSYRYVTRPVVRIPIAIAPVVNQTGDATLDPFRLALTQALLAELGDSPNARVLRMTGAADRARVPAEGDRRFEQGGRSGADDPERAQSVVIPTLLYENGSWRARAEFRNPGDGDEHRGLRDGAAVVSSLSKDTAYALMASLGEGIQQHFKANGPGKSCAPRAPAGRPDANARCRRGVRAGRSVHTNSSNFLTARKAFQASDGARCSITRWLSRG